MLVVRYENATRRCELVSDAVSGVVLNYLRASVILEMGSIRPANQGTRAGQDGSSGSRGSLMFHGMQGQECSVWRWLAS